MSERYCVNKATFHGLHFTGLMVSEQDIIALSLQD